MAYDSKAKPARMTARLMSNGGRSGSWFSDKEVSRLGCFVVSDWAQQLKELALALVIKLSRKLIFPRKWYGRGVKMVEQRRCCGGRQQCSCREFMGDQINQN